MNAAEEDSFVITSSPGEQEGKDIFASIIWKVKNITQKRYLGYYIRSGEFNCVGTNWVLTITFRPSKRARIGVSLRNIRSEIQHPTTRVEFILSHEGVEKEYYSSIRTLQEGKTIWGFETDFFSAEMLEKTLEPFQEDTLTILCNIFAFYKENPRFSVIEKTYHYKNESVDTLSKDFESLYNNPRFADVTLRLGKVEFRAHKVVLRSRSKVFEAMFEHDMQENRQNTVDLIDIEVDTVKDMLRYIYCGKTREISFEDAINLYIAADRYGLEELVSMCRNILLDELSLDNFLEVSATADSHSDQLLLEAIKSVLSKDVRKVLKSERWKTFARENPVLSLNLVESAILNE